MVFSRFFGHVAFTEKLRSRVVASFSGLPRSRGVWMGKRDSIGFFSTVCRYIVTKLAIDPTRRQACH